MLYSGWDERGDFFYLMEISYGGIPGRPIGDGMDGHSWWPLFQNIPTEYLEAYYPVRIDGYTTVEDSGGAGFHRGGNGIEKRYVYLEPGEISIHDDRWLTYPWGILGGKPGHALREDPASAPTARSELLPSKCDEVQGRAGRHARLPHRRRRRLEGPVRPAGREGRGRRGARVSSRRRRPSGTTASSSATRTRPRSCARGCARSAATCSTSTSARPRRDPSRAPKEETGLEPPVPQEPLAWAPMESGEDALAPRARARRPADDLSGAE